MKKTKEQMIDEIKAIKAARKLIKFCAKQICSECIFKSNGKCAINNPNQYIEIENSEV